MEKVNNKSKLTISLILIGLVIIFVSKIYFGRIAPKDFKTVFPNFNENINTCMIDNADKGRVELNGDYTMEIIKTLKASEYYYNGKTGNTLKGDLYHINFLELSKGRDDIILTMIVSDENLIYIGNKQYQIKSKTNNIIDFLKSIY